MYSMLFVFFKQKTAYEMRISDWSSDVCSSDLDGPSDLLCDRPRQQEAGGDLRVEGLGGGHAHLDVAPVGRVEHAVGLVGEVGPAAVDDGEDLRTTPAHEVDGAVGVGGGARLADGDHQGVGHVVAQPEAREDRKSTRLNSSH